MRYWEVMQRKNRQCNLKLVKELLKNSLTCSTYSCLRYLCFFSTHLHKYKNKIIKKLHHIMFNIEGTKVHSKFICKPLTASYRGHFTHPWNEDTLDKTQHLFNNTQQTSHNVLLEEKEMECPNKMQGDLLAQCNYLCWNLSRTLRLKLLLLWKIPLAV